MTDPEHSDPLSFILDGTDESVVADSISPQAGLFPAHRFSKSSRIFLARETLSQIPQDSALDLFVEAR